LELFSEVPGIEFRPGERLKLVVVNVTILPLFRSFTDTVRVADLLPEAFNILQFSKPSTLRP
jgi:hypothetical protein